MWAWLGSAREAVNLLADEFLPEFLLDLGLAAGCGASGASSTRCPFAF